MPFLSKLEGAAAQFPAAQTQGCCCCCACHRRIERTTQAHTLPPPRPASCCDLPESPVSASPPPASPGVSPADIDSGHNNSTTPPAPAPAPGGPTPAPGPAAADDGWEPLLLEIESDPAPLPLPFKPPASLLSSVTAQTLDLLDLVAYNFSRHFGCDKPWTISLLEFLLQLSSPIPVEDHPAWHNSPSDMPQDESKPVDPSIEGAKQDAPGPDKGKQPAVETDDDDVDDLLDTDEAQATGGPADLSSAAKKKKSKRKKIKDALTGKSDACSDKKKSAVDALTPQQIAQFMSMNPALAQEIAAQKGGGSGPGGGSDHEKTVDMLKNLSLQDIMTGLAASGKNVKDMASYKFWQTQPVQSFEEAASHSPIKEGPIKVQNVEDVSQTPPQLLAGFEWVTMDLTDDVQMKEVYELLNGHYVEDDEAMFRFNYGTSILRWAMCSPGWKKEWHVGVRATQSKKLVAFISAIPMELRVRENVIHASEVNFLCIHKKLRSKRLAPVLIKEITRLCNLAGVWQAIYTGGIVLPTPVSTCRYFHRALNWQKLYDVGFSPLPANSKPQYQIRKYALPDHTSTNRLREMQPKDLPAVYELLNRYMKRWDLVPEWTLEEAEHWLLPRKDEDKVVWCYVVEDESRDITDFFSFYSLESTVINNAKHKVIRAAYLYYYATETGLATPLDKQGLKVRLNQLMHDALILAKRYQFDVFNALSMMDNALFLEQQKFGPGDGQLHFYLFNYRANPISGGVNKKNQLDENNLSGIGLPML